MPVLAFFAVAGLALIALLFVADAALEKDGSPVIVTSQRSGLPESSHRPDKIPVLTMAPAPDPDMTSKIVRDAQPKPVAQDPMKIHPAARAARAEAMPQTPSVTQPMNDRPPMNYHYRRSEEFDTFSIKGL